MPGALSHPAFSLLTHMPIGGSYLGAKEPYDESLCLE